MHDTHETTLYCGGLCRQTDAAVTEQGCGEGGAKCGLCPLAAFYDTTVFPLPAVTEIASTEMPDPYHSLLVHERDMTSTLENFHGGRTHVRVLRSMTIDNVYQRGSSSPSMPPTSRSSSARSPSISMSKPPMPSSPRADRSAASWSSTASDSSAVGTMGYNARKDAVLVTLAALEAALAAERVRLPRGAGVDAAIAVYREAESQ